MEIKIHTYCKQVTCIKTLKPILCRQKEFVNSLQISTLPPSSIPRNSTAIYQYHANSTAIYQYHANSSDILSISLCLRLTS